MSDVKIYIADETGNWTSFNNQFTNYTIDCRYDFIADSFSMALVDNDANIKTGYWMHFVVDGNVEFRGIIETVSRSISKAGRQLTISGRSKTSMLVDEYYKGTSYDYNKTTNTRAPYLIIGDLIGKTNFLVKSKAAQTTFVDPYMDQSELGDMNTAFNNDLAEVLFDRTASVKYTDEFKAASAVAVKINPGSTIWSKINAIVNETKFEALYQDDVLFFGDLKKDRALYTDYDLNSEIAIDTKFTESIGQQYSTIALFSQPDFNYTTGKWYDPHAATVTNSKLVHKKYFTSQSSGEALNKAIKLREDQRYSGYQLTYTVQDHVATDGRAWKINRYCNVQDQYLDVNEKLVIYGRTFQFSSSGGTTTQLHLSIERSNVVDL